MILNPDIQRRAYVRVEDLLLLSWRRVEPDEHAQIAIFFEKHRYFPPQPWDDVRRVLTTLDSGRDLAQLKKTQPELACMLEQMDAKINLVLRLLHPDLKDDVLLPTRLNLGGGGVAFWAMEPLPEVGDFLNVQLTLAVEALTTVRFFVQVLRLDEPDEAGLTKVACQFNPILDDSREQIVQHVFKRQTNRLRMQHNKQGLHPLSGV